MPTRTVLVVDDEQDIRDLLLLWLRDDPRCAGVSEAEDLETAVKLVAETRPDAVLLDFFLGKRVCVEMLPEMRAAAPQSLIVVYTASRRAAEAAGALAAGADAIVEKGSVSVDGVIELVLSDELEERRRYRAESPGA